MRSRRNSRPIINKRNTPSRFSTVRRAIPSHSHHHLFFRSRSGRGMGGCATKPREPEAEAEAPVPLEEPSTSTDTKAEGAGEEKEELRRGGEKTEMGGEEGSAQEKEEHVQPDENRRRSLGLLFKENEEIKVSSEENKMVVEGTIKSSTTEAKDAVQQPKIGGYPVEESAPRTVEPQIPNTTQEEASCSDSATSQAIIKDVKQVDLNPKEEDISVVKEVVDLDLEVTENGEVPADKEPASSNVAIA